MSKFYFIDNELKVVGKYNGEKIEEIFDYEDQIIGNIYRGRVESRNKNLNASFVNIGEEEYGYLAFHDGGDLHEQSELLVQVKKTQQGKGARLTAEISVGNDVVRIFPNKRFKKFSKKILEKNIGRILADTHELLKEHRQGILFRTKAQELTKKELQQHLKYYYQVAQKLETEVNKRPTPKLLYTEHFLSDYYRFSDKSYPWLVNTKGLVSDVDNNITYDSTFSLRFHPKLLFDYKRLFEKKLFFDDGWSIVIEKTEAAILIDVNSGMSINGKNFEETAFLVNSMAAKEIMRQIRLRNLSGIILIDFLKMKEEENRQHLMSLVGSEMLKDRSTVNLYGFTSLGLMELSRKNMGFALCNKLEEK